MTKRMKCKLCSTVVEELPNQIVSCKCGGVSVDGITKSIFCTLEDCCVEIDDNGREIIPETKGYVKPGLLELMRMLDTMIKNIEDLPTYTMSAPITHYDLLSALMLISSILKKCNSHDKEIKEE